MAVEDNAAAMPSTSAVVVGVPKSRAPPATASTVSPTCIAPPTTKRRAMDRRRSSESSIPIEKRRSTTPTSASRWISSTREARPSPDGPARAPATSRPAVEGSRSRAATIETSTATAKRSAS
jgi:hypothetical protein